MTAKQLLKFINSIKEIEEIDDIAQGLFTQKGDLAVKLEFENNSKNRKLYRDISEKIEAIEIMKHQRLLFYKLAFFGKK